MTRRGLSTEELPGFNELPGFEQSALRYLVEEIIDKELGKRGWGKKRVWLVRRAFEPWMEEWLRTIYIEKGDWKTLYIDKMSESGMPEWELVFSKREEVIEGWSKSEKQRELVLQASILIPLIVLIIFLLWVFST